MLAKVDDHFGLRLQAELEALGFHAVLAPPSPDPASAPSLEDAARANGAIAAIRVVPSERGVEVGIADRVTGKTLSREVKMPAEQGDSSDQDAALALAAVDLLRASLLEVALPKAPVGEVPATREISDKLAIPAPQSLAPPRPPALRLSLAPGVMWSPGGMDASGSLDVGLSWVPSAHVGASAFVAIPLSSPTVSRGGNSADLTVWLAGVGMRFVFTAPENPWAPSADAGVMVTSLGSRGTADQGFAGKQVSATIAAPFVRAGLALSVAPMLRVRADVLAGVIVQGVSVRVAGVESARFGQPIVLPTLGVDFGWF